ncbi:MAG: hypothetical protein J7L55_00600, partial [Desulfurococcales archaeon]|nr:hypothetical protein [Desulfurococcales archaeon]
PVESPSPATPSPRGAGYLFGRPVTEWVIRKFRVKEIFRGHEPVYNGYKFNHDGKVMTIFSRLGPPYFNKRAVYVVVDMDVDAWWRKLKHFVISLTG